MEKEKISSFLDKHRMVGLDSLCFIYHFEENPDYLPFTSALFQSVEKKGLIAIASVLTYLEVLVGPKKKKMDNLVNLYRYVFHSFPNLVLAGVDLHIADLASDLRGKYGLETPDAINVATASAMKASLFITNDKSLKKIKEIEVVIMRDLLN